MDHIFLRETPAVLAQCRILLELTYGMSPEQDPIDLFGKTMHLYQELRKATLVGETITPVAHREAVELGELLRFAHKAGFHVTVR